MQYSSDFIKIYLIYFLKDYDHQSNADNTGYEINLIAH